MEKLVFILNNMKKLFLLLVLLILTLFSTLSFAQYAYQVTGTTVATGNGTGYKITGSGATVHKIVWTVTGSLAACSLTVDTSADGSSWSTGGAIGSQTCTSNGTFTSGTVISNYTRVSYTIGSGGGTLGFNLLGYVTAPSGGGTLSSYSNFGSVTFSATPTFDGSSNTDTFKITLTGDVTSSTFSNGVSGHTYTFIVCQDATGGRAFVPPTSMKQYGTWMAALSQCITQRFAYDGTNLNSIRESYIADIRPITANAMDDEFDGNVLNTTTPPWVWNNQGTATATVTLGVLNLTNPSGATNQRGISQTAPATPYTFTAKIGSNVSVPFGECGLFLRESATSKLEDLVVQNEGTPVSAMVVQRWTNNTTRSVVSRESDGYGFGYPIYYRIQADGTNLNYSVSSDGLVWTQIYTELKAAFFTTAPDQIGINSNAFGGTVPFTCSVDWFRRTQ